MYWGVLCPPPQSLFHFGFEGIFLCVVHVDFKLLMFFLLTDTKQPSLLIYLQKQSLTA